MCAYSFSLVKDELYLGRVGNKTFKVEKIYKLPAEVLLELPLPKTIPFSNVCFAASFNSENSMLETWLKF